MDHQLDVLLDLAAMQRDVEARIRKDQVGEAFADLIEPRTRLLTSICPDGMANPVRKVQS